MEAAGNAKAEPLKPSVITLETLRQRAHQEIATRDVTITGLKAKIAQQAGQIADLQSRLKHSQLQNNESQNAPQQNSQIQTEGPGSNVSPENLLVPSAPHTFPAMKTGAQRSEGGIPPGITPGDDAPPKLRFYTREYQFSASYVKYAAPKMYFTIYSPGRAAHYVTHPAPEGLTAEGYAKVFLGICQELGVTAMRDKASVFTVENLNGGSPVLFNTKVTPDYAPSEYKATEWKATNSRGM